MCFFKVCHLIFKYLGIFPKVFLLLISSLILLLSHNLHDFYSKFVHIYFMAQNMVYGECSVENILHSYCWLEYLGNIELSDKFVQVSYVLIDSLSTTFIDKRSMLDFPTTVADFKVSFSSITVFDSHISTICS